MLYDCLVINVDTLYSHGTIRVRIYNWYNPPNFVNGEFRYIDDLSKNEYFANKDLNLEESGFEPLGEAISEDFQALVFAPLGGGNNYGFMMPPVANSRGVCAFLDGNFESPIFLGSYFVPIRDENFRITGLKAPSDNPEKEGENSDLLIEENGQIINQKLNPEINNTITLRTKKTFRDPTDEKNLLPLSFDEVRTDNLISLDSERVRLIRHNTQWKKKPEGSPLPALTTEIEHYQEILIDRDYDQEGDSKEQITTTIQNLKDKKSNTKRKKENWEFTEIKNEYDEDEPIKTRQLTIEKDTGLYELIIDDQQEKKKLTLNIGKNNYDLKIENNEDEDEPKKTRQLTIEKDTGRYKLEILDDEEKKKHTIDIDNNNYDLKIENIEDEKSLEVNLDDDRIRSKITVPGKSNENIQTEDSTTGTITGSSGTTSLKYSTQSETLKFSDHHGHSIKANGSSIDVNHTGGTNIKLTAAQVAVNGSNLVVLK